MTSVVQLRILPSARCLYDDTIHVKVAGLKAKQLVVLKARSTDDKGVLFSSSANYRADGNGEIDLERDPSLRGSYTGVEPMGLLWSLKADTMHTKFHKQYAEKPHFVNISVHEEEGPGTALVEITNERQLLAEGVSRLYVKKGNIRGVLFTPPGEGPFPAVLDLYAFERGLSERRACLLANRGFVVLTIALYGHDDLPKSVHELHLDNFEEAIEFLRNAPKVCGNGVGVISLSKGGDLALSIATYLSHVTATVWINGCNANTAFPLFYRKRQILPPLMFDPSKSITKESGALNIKSVTKDPMAEQNKDTLIPIEQAKGHFLFAAAEDDLNWDSLAFMNMMSERLKLHGKDNYESISYPASGHYLEPPYGPYCPSSFHRIIGKPSLWGGEPRSHAAAEVHLWKKIQDFFKTHLTSNDSVTKAKL